MAANGKATEKQDYLVQKVKDFFDGKEAEFIDNKNGTFSLQYQGSDGIWYCHVFYDFDEITIEENGDYLSCNLKELIEKELKELNDKKSLKRENFSSRYYPPRIVQFGTILKEGIYSILSQYRLALPNSIDGERIRQNKIAIAYEDANSILFKLPDDFTRVASAMADLKLLDDIFKYINAEIIKDKKNDSPTRFTQALYEIKILVLHEMVKKEYRYYELEDLLEYAESKIKNTKDQEIQPKWQELKDHVKYRMKWVKPNQCGNLNGKKEGKAISLSITESPSASFFNCPSPSISVQKGGIFGGVNPIPLGGEPS